MVSSHTPTYLRRALRLVMNATVPFLAVCAIGISPGEFAHRAFAQSYPFPGHLEDLSPGLYWYWGQRQHPAGNQELGYDLGAIRFDEESSKFVRFHPGKDGTENNHYLIYGMPVYAIADGEVIICWRNAPENPRPGELHSEFTGSPRRIFGGGNFMFVDHLNGEVALYAHFQPGTVPSAICPNNDVFHNNATNNWNAAVPAGSRPRINRGDFLGRAGNAGNSGGPHHHISLHSLVSGGTSPAGAAVALPFNSFRHKSTAFTRDLPTDWIQETQAPLRPGPIVILPASSTPQYPPAAWIGKPWDEFLAQWQIFEQQGYRLHDFETYVSDGRRLYAGIFQPGSYKPAAWIGKPWEEFLMKWGQLENLNYRLHDLEVYEGASGLIYSGVFTDQRLP
jgi:murein DD-endopeptidase MepM/ murein hydrolase activator NlpD